ncbi:hypothetical protein UF75_3105 [Desulfosporosinus sp. I2]|uniref:hypothetical protein n=1 Tax=Desulfosporosinus sp. I2 TaxID=1617025 RepID=UPI0005ED955C|nr:hypothetical protein [Desulfosporosinus sp. I2]KJR46493.1 hypothetical protein UF75_3105 [Desulfosporosinus sp. I2]
MKPLNNPNLNFYPYILILGFGFVLLIWLFSTNVSKAFFTITPIKGWNTIDPDVTTNGNTLRALTLLQTKKGYLTPTTPLPSLVFNKPSNYYGKYLQFSGNVKSVQPFSPTSKLESITIGSSSEIIVLANDGRTIIDFFLIGRNQNFSLGAPITFYGYSSGIRYVQDAQGFVTPGLVLIGSLQR